MITWSNLPPNFSYTFEPRLIKYLHSFSTLSSLSLESFDHLISVRLSSHSLRVPIISDSLVVFPSSPTDCFHGTNCREMWRRRWGSPTACALSLRHTLSTFSGVAATLLHSPRAPFFVPSQQITSFSLPPFLTSDTEHWSTVLKKNLWNLDIFNLKISPDVGANFLNF